MQVFKKKQVALAKNKMNKNFQVKLIVIYIWVCKWLPSDKELNNIIYFIKNNVSYYKNCEVLIELLWRSNFD